MAVKRAGRRVNGSAAIKNQNKSYAKTACEKRKSTDLQEKWRLLQLVICCAAFLALVAVKLLLPGKMEQINEKISDALHQNMDVQTVFSAVGRAFAGEEVSEELAHAVFGGQPVAVDAEAEFCTVESISHEEAAEAMKALKSCSQQTMQRESDEEAAPVLASVQYSPKNLPENVCMEQQILGLEYITPLHGTVSSNFGYREHPVEGEERFHYGVDLAADKGTPICCFADGTVRAVGESSSYGKYCVIDHGNGLDTLYAHCDKITVSSGSALRMGEKLGEVGETGMATGPHLHFELHKDGNYLDPIYYVSTT